MTSFTGNIIEHELIEQVRELRTRCCVAVRLLDLLDMSLFECFTRLLSGNPLALALGTTHLNVGRLTGHCIVEDSCVFCSRVG